MEPFISANAVERLRSRTRDEPALCSLLTTALLGSHKAVTPDNAVPNDIVMTEPHHPPDSPPWSPAVNPSSFYLCKTRNTERDCDKFQSKSLVSPTALVSAPSGCLCVMEPRSAEHRESHQAPIPSSSSRLPSSTPKTHQSNSSLRTPSHLLPPFSWLAIYSQENDTGGQLFLAGCPALRLGPGSEPCQGICLVTDARETRATAEQYFLEQPPFESSEATLREHSEVFLHH
ncbi:hypothetical protein EYF80_019074 [Liparis tanakae]|uniref:Uncharacterized protein n=1 Tax=Liparis tanakae TaxID=230148 RepID=A0A4Z2HY48_9TELE|nr:hypothetical protein EYF80_019074 [Liparis tanakae]